MGATQDKSRKKDHQDDNHSRNIAGTGHKKPSTGTDHAVLPGGYAGRLPSEKAKKPSTGTDPAVLPGAHAGRLPSEKPKNPPPRVRYHSDNLDFYLNKITSKPAPGYRIEDMLKWQGDYAMLERNHRYIQWLFPIPEGSGMNMYAQPLMDHEAKAMQENDTIQKRLLSAYKMMLDFYGMQLLDTVHGTVARSNKGWRERYEHLNRSRHNYLQITRILKSIGELGYMRFQAPWVNFLIEEAVVKGTLPNLNGGCLNHWMSAVLNEEEQMLFRRANGLPVNQQNSVTDVNSEDEEDNEENVAASAKAEVQYDIAKMKEYDTENDLAKLKLENIESIAAKTHLGQKYEENNEAGLAKSKHKDKENLKSELPSDNLLFYRDQIHSRPSPGFTMQTILKYKGDCEFIENYPYFIQWIFPTREKSSSNSESQVLYDHEVQAIKADDTLNSRVLEAYQMMLECYGMQLLDRVYGKIGRNSEYEKGYKHLNKYPDNYARITRILKSLGELGYERFQVPWIEYLVTDGIDNDLLPTLKGTDIMQWINAIWDKEERQAMFRKYQVLAGHGEDNIEKGVSGMEADTNVKPLTATRYSAHGSQPSTNTVAPSSMYNSKHNLNRTEDRVNLQQPAGGQVAIQDSKRAKALNF